MILVTGATGFVGRSLTHQLTRAGYEWRAYEGQISNTRTLRAQLADADVVIHLAGAEARGRNRLLQRVDVEGTKRLLEECRRTELRHLIVLSRLGADPHSLHTLLRAKGSVERLVRHSDLNYTIVRAATLYGRDDRFTEIILGLAIWSWPFVWLPGGGRVAMQPLWVEDLARCLLATIERADLLGKTITVGGEERLRYREIVAEILQVTQRKRIPLQIPLALIRPLTTFFFRWWAWPAVSPYFASRFFLPEVTELDTILRNYHFRPARFRETIAYLRRPGMRWRIFRR